MIKNYDFEFEGSPKDVGMKTGATIHTMNGLNMHASRVDPDAPLPSSDGYWEKEHLKRGFSANGKSFPTKEAVAAQNLPKRGRPDDPGNAYPSL
jgi:hypothetical protein